MNDDTLREQVATELLRDSCRNLVQPGFCRTRMVRGGPFVGAKIERGEAGWRCVIDGEPGAWHPDPALAPGLLNVWLHGTSCTEAEYLYRVGLGEWAKQHATDSPQAKPLEVYDPATAPPIF